MVSRKFLIYIVIFLLNYNFLHVTSVYRVPSRVYFPIQNITEEVLKDQRDIFDEIFRTRPLRYEVSRVDKLSDEPDSKKWEVLNFVSEIVYYICQNCKRKRKY